MSRNFNLNQNSIDNKIRIIFEIANNHQGNEDHFYKILNDIYKATRPFKNNFEFLIKFQFRDIPTFIDNSIDPSSNKHISRFRETLLSDKEWIEIIKNVKDKGFRTIVTPFDEISVQKALDLEIEEFKIASCSSTEWTLLNEVIKTGKYVTISTGGRNLKEIDEIYSYFAHLIPNKFTIMHCCGIYPAPIENLNLETIKTFKDRYPLANIGYSGHEDPHNHVISSLALTLGATAIERHIGKEDLGNNINLNNYSIDSNSIKNWLNALKTTLICIGSSKNYYYKNDIEQKSLVSLQRGVFLSNDIKKGTEIKASDCTFKFPIQENQLSAAEIASINNIFTSRYDLKSGTRLTNDLIELMHPDDLPLKNYVHKVRGILNQYAEYVPQEIEIEISHHYGLNKIEEFGCCLLNVINRKYCKKLIVMTEGQCHPKQYHIEKEETFRVLYGEIELILNDKSMVLKRGKEALVKAGVKHSFKANTNCIIEELSTTSKNTDSYYEDSIISQMPREKRKTIINLHFDHYQK